MELTEKQIRRFTHIKTQELYLKWLIIGGVAFGLFQIPSFVLGVFRLPIYLLSCSSFVITQTLIYMSIYKIVKQVILKDLNKQS